jgi:heat shock protein HslJ
VNAARTRFTSVLALALAVAGCTTTGSSSGSSGPAPNLSGTRWIVTRIDGAAPLRDSTLHADFGVDGRVNGDSGCNSFSGPYIQTGNNVQIGELLSTRRACVDSDRQRQESRVLAILQGANTARMDKGQLNLRAANGSGSLLLSPGSVNDSSYASPRRVQFDCQGMGLTVEFEGERANLTWSEGRDTLNRQPAASGIWYQSSRNSLRGKQDLVWVQGNSPSRTCRELK